MFLRLVICFKYLSRHTHATNNPRSEISINPRVQHKKSQGSAFYAAKDANHLAASVFIHEEWDHFIGARGSFCCRSIKNELNPNALFALDIMMKYAVKMFIVRCSNSAIIHRRIPHCFGTRPCPFYLHLDHAFAHQNLEITFSSAIQPRQNASWNSIFESHTGILFCESAGNFSGSGVSRE